MSSKKTVSLLSGKGLPIGGRICGGELVPVPAPVKFDGTAPSGILYAGYSHSAGRYFLCTKEFVYETARLGYFIILCPMSGSTPFMVEEVADGVPRAVVINGKKAVYHTGSSFMMFDIAVNLCCGAMHCGRLFGADGEDKTILRWSGEGGVADWKEGLYGSGSVRLDPERGIILNILEYGEKLVIVRKYGLTVASMYGTPENFTVNLTDTDSDEIYADTAAVAGGKLYFYTASGLHAFDGNVIKPIATRFDVMTAPTSAGQLDGVYYLAGSGGVLCYDTSDGESWLVNFSAEKICTVDTVYLFNSSGTYALKENSAFEFSEEVDFSNASKKTLTKLSVKSDGVDVEVSNGRVSRTFKNASGIIKPRLRGEKFTVKFSGKNPVRKVTAEAEVLNAI